MSKYVNAADAAEKIAEKHGIRIADLRDTFGDIPAADVVEVRHGRWEFGKDLPDSFGHEGLDTDEIVRQKMAYNRGRPYKHGKRC